MFIALITKSAKVDIVLPARGVSALRNAVVAATREEAAKKAIQVREEWTSKGNGPYRILVGQLTTEIIQPVQFTEVPLISEDIRVTSTDGED